MMSNPDDKLDQLSSNHSEKPAIRSLNELIDHVSGKNIPFFDHEVESGLTDQRSFPFLAIVGQDEMKLALILTIINPLIGGLLLIGPRGTGKTTAVRSLIDILPENEISQCYYGCLPTDIDLGGMDAVCPDCAKKYALGQPLTKKEKVHLIDLPLNTSLENVIGGIDDKSHTHHRMRLRKGILASADQNLLYIDEINLLSDEIINSILDASAMGKYTVRSGNVFVTYRSRFTLIGSMNPEEGNLRPQIMDRFGLRIVLRGLDDAKERKEAYERSVLYKKNPNRFIAQYENETNLFLSEIQEARKSVWNVTIPDQIIESGIDLIRNLKIESMRAEITLFEAAKAYAAADKRESVTYDDLLVVSPMALRLRGSELIEEFYDKFEEEEKSLKEQIKKSFREN